MQYLWLFKFLIRKYVETNNKEEITETNTFVVKVNTKDQNWEWKSSRQEKIITKDNQFRCYLKIKTVTSGKNQTSK